ncbi:MAG: hypothetical protein R3A79_11340 [Nannocystaceae bacterium]
MKLLARLRRGSGSTAIALVTATVLTAAWAAPAEAAKPKKSQKSQQPEPEPEPASDEEVAAAAAALGDLSGDGLEVSVEGDEGQADGEAGEGEVSGAELDMSARAAFDRGDYATAAEEWTLALEVTPEGKSTHMARAVMLENAVIARRQVYAETRDRKALFAAQETIHTYMRACKRAYDFRCNSHPETDDARALLADVRGEIDASEDQIARRAPPEHLTAIGGRPLDVTKRNEPVPPWAFVATVGGAAIVTGGAYLFYWARTEPSFQTSDETAVASRFADEDTTTDTDTDTDTSTSSTGTLSGVTLSDETKGKLYTGLGVSVMAVGVGFIVLGALRMARTRRYNRRESLALSPALGPGGGGVMVQGRF